GLNAAVTEPFNAAVSSVTEDNQLQFDIVNKRKAIVLENLKVLNDLYAQLTELLSVGKSLYRNIDPVKSREYVFNSLMKSVRNTKKSKKEQVNETDVR
ncbi:MAG: hypothetical protein LBR08_11485, partial [Bacteroidales bacterium]|nr:hypothetical protein [Bacteroidales bacterium]